MFKLIAAYEANRTIENLKKISKNAVKYPMSACFLSPEIVADLKSAGLPY